MIAALLASACSDFIFTLITTNVPVFADILGDNVTELNEILATRKPDMLLLKAKLRNILIMYQEIAQ